MATWKNNSLPVDLIYDLNKYKDYFFETKGFTSDTALGQISQRAIESAHSIRGREREPAVIMHGIMPRSGTVYVGELLRLHPDLVAYPQGLWEFPALQLVKDVRKLQQKFLMAYKMNREREVLGENDFLPLFGASLLGYLHEAVPNHQRVLVKMPSVQYLSHFFSVFPHENLLVLIRDGRDLVHSTLRTWPKLNFIQVCLRWNRCAQTVLKMHTQIQKKPSSLYWLARYEDALAEPTNFIQQACKYLGLDESRYPFEKIEEVRVIGSSKLEQKQGKVTWQHIEKPKDFKPTEYWRQWSSVRKLIFKTIAGRSLVELGYSKDLSW